MLHVKRSLQNLLLGVCVVDCQPIKTSTLNLHSTKRGRCSVSVLVRVRGLEQLELRGVAVYCIYSYLILLHELAAQTTIIARPCDPAPLLLFYLNCGRDCWRDTWLKSGQAGRQQQAGRQVVKTF